ncbi:MAG: hypothetical protein HOM68_28780 [Gemmatimonadetes bacterium]|nr:hypothetical protein [Gemmatimonadota bacterium]MBT5060574.1 hypothetical protein [Gemmatimonadota bacterium]MBT5588975.1 hypothetical protein [Gemmatimonadota bacterium]MBT5965471.1 hypothetical protein [Gemmatimonadota bacterium]MBT6626472.1 hypothetical protein [Gemmatimonadota bacterium]
MTELPTTTGTAPGMWRVFRLLCASVLMLQAPHMVLAQVSPVPQAQTDPRSKGTVLADTTDSTAVDSAVGVAMDPLQPWRQWPSIDRAVELGRLDGPTDILEKGEIIADRLDDLRREDAMLDSLKQIWEGRDLALAGQLEVLEDLADLQLGGDLQLQQRIQTVRDNATETLRWRERIATATNQLDSRITRLQLRADEYKRRADQLRRLEEEAR